MDFLPVFSRLLAGVPFASRHGAGFRPSVFPILRREFPIPEGRSTDDFLFHSMKYPSTVSAAAGGFCSPAEIPVSDQAVRPARAPCGVHRAGLRRDDVPW
jgi:hypothetical protein